MRKIEEIVEELRSHPDCLHVFFLTKEDMVSNYMAELDLSPYDVSIDDFINEDVEYVKECIDGYFDEIDYSGGVFPPYLDLPSTGLEVRLGITSCETMNIGRRVWLQNKRARTIDKIIEK